MTVISIPKHPCLFSILLITNYHSENYFLNDNISHLTINDEIFAQESEKQLDFILVNGSHYSQSYDSYFKPDLFPFIIDY